MVPPPLPQDKKLLELPTYKQLLQQFINTEIIRWSLFQQQYAAEMAAAADIFEGTCACGGGCSSSSTRLR